jgi:2,3-bisphosphoglycerate-dependent phosphoglycerate mutase
MTHLYLIRHGEAIANVEPIIGGMKGDAGLTPHGVKQAEALRDRLLASGEIEADALISSTLARARQTAEIIAPALGGLPLILDDDVQEMRVGEADGMHVADFKATYGEPNFRKEPFRPIAPGGENWGQFVLRAATALDRIVRAYEDKTVVVVCHGGVVIGSMIYGFGLSSLMIPYSAELDPFNTSITHWEYRPAQENASPRWRLICYNDASHTLSVGQHATINWRDVPPRAVPGKEHPAVPLPTEEDDDA